MTARIFLFSILNVSTLAKHGLRSAFSMLGIAAGTAMVAAVLILNSSLQSSYQEAQSATGGGAALEVTTPAAAGLTTTVVDEVSRVPGVRVAAPLLETWATARASGRPETVLVLGIDSRFRAVAGSVAAETRLVPAKPQPGAAVPGSLLSTLGARVGQPITLSAGSTLGTVPVTATLKGRVVDSIDGGQFVVLPLQIAQTVLDLPGRVSSVAVVASVRSPQALARLRAAIRAVVGPSPEIVTPTEAEGELSETTQPLVAATSFFALLTLLVGAYLTYNTAVVTAVERRREVAVLRALGEGRASILVRAVGEALLLGLAGAAVGLVGGAILGSVLTKSVPHFIGDAYGFSPQTSVSVSALVVAAIAGLAAALLATFIATAAMLKLSPAEAARPAASGEVSIGGNFHPYPAVAGGALIAAGLAGSLVMPRQAVVMALVTVAGAVLVSPDTLRTLIRIGAGGLRFLGGVGFLAGASLVQNPRRAARAGGVLMFAVVLVSAVTALTANVNQSVDRFLSSFTFGLYVSASSNEYFTAPLNQSVIPSIAAIDGVEGVYPLRSRFIPWRSGQVWLLGDDPTEPAMVHLGYVEGSAAAAATGYRQNGMVISTQIARLDGLHVGTTVTLHTAVGPRVFHITAVIEDWSYPAGVMAIGNDAFSKDYLQPEVNELELRLRPGVDPAAVRTEIEQKLGSRYPLVIRTAAQVRELAANDVSATFAPLAQMRDVVAGAAALALFNGMLVTVLQRHRELGVLHAIGAKRDQIWGSVITEGIAVAVAALVPGEVLGVLIHILGVQYLISTSGAALTWTFQPTAVGATAAAALLAALAGSAYPAIRAARLPVLDAIRYE
jgi:putative ABC transport system permease protein